MFIYLFLFCGAMAWPQNETPKMSIDYLNQYAGEVKSFIGNQTHTDHFKLLKEDGGSLLIGARNIVYNISLDTLQENVVDRLVWDSRERDRELCLVKGKNEDDCNNYIRVLAKAGDDQLLVCGTNSYKPRCRYYRGAGRRNSEAERSGRRPRAEAGRRSGWEVEKEFSGVGYCPYDPKHNSTSIYTGGALYSGTVSDFSGSDSLIIKEQVRTEQYNFKHLNGPDFVGSAEDEDFVYFFFREEAVEFINCGKNVYSRVARVCKKDQGGPRNSKNRWTTFLKARLNCSIPGIFPFYFNEIQSVYQIDDRVFGVFNTPDNAISGSAICSFTMEDIYKAFSGDFKVQNDPNSNWLPVNRPDQPGTCRNSSEDLTEEHLNFLKDNVLMDAAVPSAFNLPHFVKTSPHERLTSIAVDPKVLTADGRRVDVLFVGTTRGRILKMATFDNGGIPQTNLIEDLQLFPYHVAVNNLLIVPARNGSENGGNIQNGANLVALSDHEVKSVPMHRCGAQTIQNCAACVALQDPYCAWSVEDEACTEHAGSAQDTSTLLQQVSTGAHPGCPNSKTVEGLRVSSTVYDTITFFDEEAYSQPRERPYISHNSFYSPQTFAIGVIFAALAALLVGAGAGHLVTRRYIEQHSYLKCGHAYLEAQAMDRTRKEETSHYTEPNFIPTPSLPPFSSSSSSSSTTSSSSPLTQTSTTQNNLLVNIPEKNKTEKQNIPITTNMPLNKPQKIYI